MLVDVLDVLGGERSGGKGVPFDSLVMLTRFLLVGFDCFWPCSRLLEQSLSNPSVGLVSF